MRIVMNDLYRSDAIAFLIASDKLSKQSQVIAYLLSFQTRLVRKTIRQIADDLGLSNNLVMDVLQDMRSHGFIQYHSGEILLNDILFDDSIAYGTII